MLTAVIAEMVSAVLRCSRSDPRSRCDAVGPWRWLLFVLLRGMLAWRVRSRFVLGVECPGLMRKRGSRCPMMRRS